MGNGSAAEYRGAGVYVARILKAGVVASCAKTGATTLIVIIVTRTCRHMANRVHRLHRESCRGAHSQRETSPRSGPRLFRLADAAIG